MAQSLGEARSDRAQLLFVLHAHLPYVLGHGTWPHGEEWLWEAAAESYLPLIVMLRRRVRRGLHRRVLSVGLTPILCEMLADDRFPAGLERWLRQKADAARADAAQFIDDPKATLARAWAERFDGLIEQFQSIDRDLLAAFRALRDAGVVEIVGGPATHPFSPLLSDEGPLRLQYSTGRKSHLRHFGASPSGCWLPECGYRPDGEGRTGTGEPAWHARGMAEVLDDHGFRYSFVESHMVVTEGLGGGSSPGNGKHSRLQSSPPQRLRPALSRIPLRDEWAGPSRVASAELCVFPRDPYCSSQVWSSQGGYPGHVAYLEFHKRHHPGGHRYWSITDGLGDLASKQLYDPAVASRVVQEQVQDFLRGVLSRVEGAGLPRAVLCAPYDAELFGHWWAEGPSWLEQVLEVLDDHPRLQASTPGEALRHGGAAAPRCLPAGSWGEGGDDRVWSGLHAHEFWSAIEDAQRRARVWWSSPAHGPVDDRLRRQAARTLLLMQASDWPFLLHREQAPDYAQMRILGHREDFDLLHRLGTTLREREVLPPDELRALERLEARDRIFPDVTPRDLLEGPSVR